MWPHNNTNKKIVKITKMAKTERMDFHSFMDMNTIPWGYPAEHWVKFQFSFYLTSDVIEANLKQLHHDPIFQESLHLGKLQMSAHSLKKTESKQIGFFLGKSPEHTSFRDKQNCLQKHLHTTAHSLTVQMAPFQLKTIKFLTKMSQARLYPSLLVLKIIPESRPSWRHTLLK